jgi:hypothetical protein
LDKQYCFLSALRLKVYGTRTKNRSVDSSQHICEKNVCSNFYRA